MAITLLNFLSTDKKAIVFNTINDYLQSLSLTVTSHDIERPWGGFFVIDEKDSEHFIDLFFPDLEIKDVQKGGSLTPKILVVEPGKRLSWQYHYRREELWRVLNGPVGVITSPNDFEGQTKEMQAEQIVQFTTETRHRLIGLENWGVVAEFWQHTNSDDPSDEEDIVRVSDDFSRN